MTEIQCCVCGLIWECEAPLLKPKKFVCSYCKKDVKQCEEASLNHAKRILKQKKAEVLHETY